MRKYMKSCLYMKANSSPPVAQRLERAPYKRQVEGSNPSRRNIGAIYQGTICDLYFAICIKENLYMLFFPTVNGKRAHGRAGDEVQFVYLDLAKLDSYVKVCE